MPLRLERKYHSRRSSSESYQFALGIPTFHFKEVDDSRILKWTVGVAVLLHLLLLVVRVPALEREVREIARGGRIHVLESVRFEEPPARRAGAIPPAIKKKAQTDPDSRSDSRPPGTDPGRRPTTPPRSPTTFSPISETSSSSLPTPPPGSAAEPVPRPASRPASETSRAT